MAYYKRGGYSNNYGNGYQSRNDNRGKKKSGAHCKMIKDGKRKGAFVIMGWMRAGRQIGGLINIACWPLKSNAKYGNKSKQGNFKYVCEIIFTQTGETMEKTGYWTGSQESGRKPSGGKMYIPDMNIVISPEGNFTGRIRKR